MGQERSLRSDKWALSRRDVLRYFAAGSVAAGAAALTGSVASACAEENHVGENAAGVGSELIDYAGGVPSAEAIKAAGFAGAIRYVSDRRPGAEWMVGKPILMDEAQALQAAGLAVVSCYQFGKGETSDWRGGYEAGLKHAKRGLELHLAAGGPANRPIYTSIDDNPTFDEFETLIAPYLKAWEDVLGKSLTGVYANAPTISWSLEAGHGTYFWQHNWGSNGVIHEAAHIHQYEIDKYTVDGVGVDRNRILKADCGRW